MVERHLYTVDMGVRFSNEVPIRSHSTVIVHALGTGET